MKEHERTTKTSANRNTEKAETVKRAESTKKRTNKERNFTERAGSTKRKYTDEAPNPTKLEDQATTKT